MSDSDLIASFLASRGATVIPTGERALERGEMRAALRGEAFESNAHRNERHEHDLRDTAAEARLNGQRVIGYNGSTIVTDRGEY
jgi:hypothetical protein